MIYGNEGCGQETHTAQGAPECCMGLSTTHRAVVIVGNFNVDFDQCNQITSFVV